MQEHFLAAYIKTRGIEGFYSNDPLDPGGETIYGIARSQNPNWSGWALVDSYKKRPDFPKNIKGNQTLLGAARTFYKVQFWDALKLDQVKNKQICEELFDTAVNMSVKRAATFLQTALAVSNDRGRAYSFPDNGIDGIVGQGTITALNAHPKPVTVLKLLNVMQGQHYIDQCLNNSDNEKYLNGWFARVFEADFI